MNEKDIAFTGLAIVGVVIWVACVAGVVFVAVHFIAKFW